jgi:hypothetical protein
MKSLLRISKIISIYFSFFQLIFSTNPLAAQSDRHNEQFGNTLNLGLGIGYYGYITKSTPAFHADYEFQVANNFTLAPFITFYTFQNSYYWGNPNYPYRNYSYRQSVIPIGVKATYYFDKLLEAGNKWDFI